MIDSLHLEIVGKGADVSELYVELQLGGEASLCLGGLIVDCLRRKALHYHFALFSPWFGDMKYLSFDVRELLGDQSIMLPTKMEARLKSVALLLESRFGSDEELLNGVLSTRTPALVI